MIIPLLTVDDKTGSRFIVVKLVAYDPSKITIIDVVKVYRRCSFFAIFQNALNLIHLQLFPYWHMQVSFMISDMLLCEDDDLVVCGQVVVIDLQGLSFGHIGQMTPSLIRYEFSISTFILKTKFCQSYSNQKGNFVNAGRLPHATERLSFHQFVAYI